MTSWKSHTDQMTERPIYRPREADSAGSLPSSDQMSSCSDQVAVGWYSCSILPLVLSAVWLLLTNAEYIHSAPHHSVYTALAMIMLHFPAVTFNLILEPSFEILKTIMITIKLLISYCKVVFTLCQHHHLTHLRSVRGLPSRLFGFTRCIDKKGDIIFH